MKVAYCPTGKILAEFFAKPLQSNSCVQMQEKILNLPIRTSATLHRSVLRSENKNNGENDGENNGENKNNEIIQAARSSEQQEKTPKGKLG